MTALSPPPPPPPPASRPSWLPFAIGAGVVAVLLLALFAGGVFSNDEPTAGSTTTTEGVTTTTGGVTTTSADPSTTTAPGTVTTTTPGETSTTTQTASGFSDFFDGSSPAQPVYGEASMTFVFTEQGRGRIRATATQQTLAVLYPDPVGDALLQFTIRPQVTSPGSGAGAIFFADDPSDGILDQYVLVELVEGPADASSLNLKSFSNGGLIQHQSTPIPVAAFYVPGNLNTMLVVVKDGLVTVSLNGFQVAEWPNPSSATSGWFGFFVFAAVPDEAVVVDDLIVLPL